MDLFEEYVKNYDFNDSDISYKYKHTLRVQALCKLIAKELGLNKREIEIASLCGLYHDIGRFEQDKRYNSFQDTKTFDHGDFGSEIFSKEFSSKMMLNEEEKQIITKSILYHNKLEIGKCSDKEALYTKITRDADKLDILYVFANRIKVLAETDGTISDLCHKKFMKHMSLARRDVTNATEENLLILAFTWDINFDVSLKLIKDNSYFEKIEKILNNEIYTQYFEEIRNYLKEI